MNDRGNKTITTTITASWMHISIISMRSIVSTADCESLDRSMYSFQQGTFTDGFVLTARLHLLTEHERGADPHNYPWPDFSTGVYKAVV